MKMSEYYQQRADEQRKLASYYGRRPEDLQKQAGRKEALAEAARYDELAKEALAEEAAEEAPAGLAAGDVIGPHILEDADVLNSYDPAWPTYTVYYEGNVFPGDQYHKGFVRPFQWRSYWSAEQALALYDHCKAADIPVWFYNNKYNTCRHEEG